MTTMIHAERIRMPGNIETVLAAARRPWLAAFVRQAVAFARKELQRRRAIRELQELDDRMLADIGLTRADVGHPPSDFSIVPETFGQMHTVADRTAWHRCWGMQREGRR
jgi:uncharacterized protein YjiS (DUF1127 family)